MVGVTVRFSHTLMVYTVPEPHCWLGWKCMVGVTVRFSHTLMVYTVPEPHCWLG